MNSERSVSATISRLIIVPEALTGTLVSLRGVSLAARAMETTPSDAIRIAYDVNKVHTQVPTFSTVAGKAVEMGIPPVSVIGTFLIVGGALMIDSVRRYRALKRSFDF